MFKILVYHGIVERTDSFDGYFPKNISIEKFRSQIDALKKKTKFLSLSEFEKKWQKRDLRNNEAMLFFDDCYQSALNGLKVLKEYEIPAVIALSTDLVEKGYSWIDDIEKILPDDFEEIIRLKKRFRNISLGKVSGELEKLSRVYGINPRRAKQKKFDIVSWREIKQIRLMGFDIVHHGHFHYPMSRLSDRDLFKDIETNVEMLKKKLNIEPHSFVYPFGEKEDYNGKTKAILKDFGFRFAFSAGKGGVNYNDPFAIPRVNSY
ncbi:MAG: polysaccharide deacetylase family protein [Candidatus Portnoybacteria bacterium]